MTNKPKYQVLKEYIIDHIENNNLRYNDAISSEIELMKQFEISRHTVRRAISDLVNEGWLYKQQGRGTFVADPSANKTGQGKMVGVITTYISEYIFPEIISGIEQGLSENGYSILLGNTNNDIDKERIILQNMVNSNISGLIVEPTKSVYPNHNKDLFEQLGDRGIPVLFIHAYYQNFKSSYVVEDDVLAGYKATKFLIENGHKCIGGIFKQDDMQGHGRYEGYRKALMEAGLNALDKQVIWYTTETMNQLFDFKAESGLNPMILIEEEVTAMVIYNDQIAMKLVDIFGQNQVHVPNQVSIVSFDNASGSDKGNVGLTTIAHPKEELGLQAAKNIIHLIHSKEVSVRKVFEPELIIRESVKKLQS